MVVFVFIILPICDVVRKIVNCDAKQHLVKGMFLHKLVGGSTRRGACKAISRRYFSTTESTCILAVFCKRGKETVSLDEAIKLYAAEAISVRDVFNIGSSVRLTAIEHLGKEKRIVCDL